MYYSTPLKSTSQNHCTTPIQRSTPLSSSSRSSSATSSTASSPSCSPSPPSRRLMARQRPRPHNLSQECLRLVTRGSGRFLLGMASLLVTCLLTTTPYERMALESSFSRHYDLPEDVDLSRMVVNLRAMEAPEVVLPLLDRTSSVQLEPTPFMTVQPIQVHFMADASNPDTTSKFILDGLERSEWLEITAISIAQLHATERQLASLEVHPRNAELPLLYIIDWGSMNRDCALLQTLFGKTTIQFTSRIVLMDFSASHRHSKCAFLEDYKRVKYTKRSVVEKRYFDTTFQWVDPGQLVQDDTIHYAPLVLRESFVDLVHNVTTALVNTTSTPTKLKRTNDLLFNWKPGDNSHYGFLRRLVAEKVSAYGGNVTSFQDSDFLYANAMLTSKICVLAQRDEWEGHYRLLEAMASGAMVLTDPMLAMPFGLKNGTNLVVYRNLAELKSYIKYYLGNKGAKERQRIAQKGYETVMGRHRSWHRMEEVVFGQAITSVDQPNAEAPLKRERPELKLVEH